MSLRLSHLRRQQKILIGPLIVIVIGLSMSTTASAGSTIEQTSFQAPHKTTNDNSTVPTLTWNQTYDETASDHVRSGVETTDGGLAIFGYTEPEVATEYDFWLIKTDPNGNIFWSKTYGGEKKDYGLSIIETADEGLAMTGYTYETGDADAWLIKTNADGEVEWNRRYGETGSTFKEDIANVVIQTTDGGFVLAGRSRSYSGGDVDGWIVKTDNNGEEEWSQTFGGPRWDEIEAIRQTPDGGYVFVGSISIDWSAAPEDLWIAKTNATGAIEWENSYGGIWNDYANSFVPTLDGGYAIAGTTVPDETGADGPAFWLVKTDDQGLMEWNRTYDGKEDERARAILQTPDGGYMLLGETYSFGAGFYDYWLIKTDSNGLEQWNQTYGGPGHERPHSLVQTSDGGFVLIGTTKPLNIWAYDCLILKIGGKLSTVTWTTTHPSFVSFDITFFFLPMILIVFLFWKRKTH